MFENHKSLLLVQKLKKGCIFTMKYQIVGETIKMLIRVLSAWFDEK